MKIQAILLSLSLIFCANLIGSESEHGHSHGNPSRRGSHSETNRQTSPFHFFNYTWTGNVLQTFVFPIIGHILAIEVTQVYNQLRSQPQINEQNHVAADPNLLTHADKQLHFWDQKVTESETEKAMLQEKLKTTSTGSDEHNQVIAQLEKLRATIASIATFRDKAYAQHQELLDRAMQNHSKLLRSHVTAPIAPVMPTHQPPAKKAHLSSSAHQHSPTCGHGHAHGGHAH